MVSFVSAYPLAAQDVEVVNALSYLKLQQDGSGCIGGFSSTAWVINAVASAGEDPASVTWKSNGKSLVDCIKKDSEWFNDGGRAATDFERQIIAMVAAGEGPTNFNGLDYVAKLKSMYDGTQMGNASLLNDDAWGVIALVAAGETDSPEVQGMVSFLEANQGQDNGWSWGVGQASDADSTATAVMALVSAGKDTTAQNIQNAMDYLKTQQNTSNAGFESWGQANPDSSAYAVDAIAAVEEDPTVGDWGEGGTDAVAYLLSWQQADGGFSNPYANPALSSSVLTTANALNALLGKPYPVRRIESIEMPIRIEAVDNTIFDGTVELPSTIDFTASNSGTVHTLLEKSLLMGLLEAAEENSFNVSVSDEWFPAMGFYVKGIDGVDAAGLQGWNVRVNTKGTGFNSVSGFVWQESSPPEPPHGSVVWFYGDWDANALRVRADSTNVEVAENVNVVVEYYHEISDEWYSIEGAIVKGGASEQSSNESGVATISFSSAGSRKVYAEKPDSKYFRSEGLEFTVSGGQQTSTSVEISGTVVPAISFTVTPAAIDFGPFGPGYSVAGNDIEIENSGSWNLEIEAEVEDTDGALYSTGLFLDGAVWAGFALRLLADPSDFLNSTAVTTTLNVPMDYAGTGTETGTITFWATATGPPA